MGIIQSEEMKDLRHERSLVMSCTPQKSSACPADGANFGLSRAEHECYLLSPGNLHQSNLWRDSAEEDRAHWWAWLSPEINQHLVLIHWCWRAGCRVTPEESERVITFLCSRLFRLRSTSNEAWILWEALVAVSGVITEVQWVEGKEEGREHRRLIPPPHTQCWSLICWWGKRFMS